MRLVIAVLLVPALALARPRIGDPAPALPANALRPGHVTIVDFAATWCGPCHTAIAALKRIVADQPDVDLVIVDVGEPAETVTAFYDKQSLPKGARVVVDTDAAIATRWGHDRFPTTFLVDRDGAIRFINRGYGAGYPARIEDKLRALVAR